ncbi:MAG: DUF1634 domain-containing protein [Anaerolineae bacterium]|nr:DUF1634 domain-containing protein [Anaerolineae bacterium]
MLQVGTGVAITLITAGLAWLAATGEQGDPDHFAVPPAALTRLEGLVTADGLLNLGLLVLMAVPVICVAIGAVWYARKRAWLYSLMIIGALLILALAVLGSR